MVRSENMRFIVLCCRIRGVCCQAKKSGQAPEFAAFGVFGVWQQDVDWMAVGIEAGDNPAQVLLVHSGTSGSRRRSVVTPDVEEDGGAGTDDGLGCVVTDEEFDAVSVVILSHALAQFPLGACRVVEPHMAVVEFGVGGVAYPKVCRAYLDIGNAGVAAHGFFVRNPEPAEGEDACRGAPITFALDGGMPGIAVQSQSPYQSFATELTAVGPQYTNPLAGGIFLNEREGDVGAVPAFGDAENGLRAVARHGGCRGAEHNGHEGEQVQQELHIRCHSTLPGRA